MKQQIISLLERAKENGTTIGDVLAEVREMRPVCLTCDDHGAVGSILDTVPCPDCSQHAETKLEWITTSDIRDVPDCVLTPSGIALKQSQTSAQDGRTQVDNDLVSSLLRIAEVAPASECEILQAAAAALARAPVAGEAQPVAECERCGLAPEDHTELHWCDNQSFRLGDAVQLGAAPQASPAADGRDAKDADPLQGAANWLVNGAGFSVYALAGSLMIGHNRAERLYDTAIAAQQGEGGGV